MKNRGALSNPAGRFEIEKREQVDDGWQRADDDTETVVTLPTTVIPEKAKSIISRNESPDIRFRQSINPYRGCEHGCIYCYARPAHAYLNLSPGLDFETKLFYKANAAELLQQELSKRSYVCEPIILGANTDPYQPIEKKLRITREILEVLQQHNHPVAIITKSALVERDLDILATMAKEQLIHVAISVTTLNTELKRMLEPRASSHQGRLRTIQTLSQAGIPVRVMAAPIIPMINDMELERMLELAAAAGAQYAAYILVRLPHEVKDLFKEWLATHFPQRAQHVMSLIQQMHGGKEYDATFGKRMRGEGNFAKLLATRFQLACRRLKLNQSPDPQLNTTLFSRPRKPSNQLDLWENLP
jgi:DNA repair photolyase